MCGIAGFIHKDPRKPVDPETLVGMAAIQYHRGPDGYGWVEAPGKGVGLAHARLSIIDLSDSGRQPFVSQNKKLFVTHNGEFYDYKRLRADATSRGDQFFSKSDTELILHLYPRRGLEGMMKELRGEFAFALYDDDKDRLVLVRDRFGIKPLYYAETRDSIVFGSEIKVLFAHPDVKRKFSSQGLFHQLMQTIVPGSTPFEGIKQVPPGHAIIIDRKSGSFAIQEFKYWDMTFPEQGGWDEGDLEEFQDRVREKLLEAVQLRLEADVPVACYLSGGIDSCIILGIASAAQQSPVKAFTIGFDNDAYDETVIAKEMAEKVRADQDILIMEASHLYDHFVKTHWHTERSIYNTLGVAKYLMSKHVHETGIKVVMTGEGSDEMFAGYPSFRRDMFLHGRTDLPMKERVRLYEELNSKNQIFRGSMLAKDEVNDPDLEAICGFTPSCLQPWLATAPRIPALIESNRKQELKGYSPGKAIASSLDTDYIKDRHALDIAQYVWIKTMLEGQILTWGGDRVDMANSMEARPAFLDHHLAELAVKIPPEMRIQNTTEKFILRETFQGLLPETLYKRQKFPFMAPPAHTDEKKLEALMQLKEDYLSKKSVESAGLLDPAGVDALFEAWLSEKTDAEDQIQMDALVNHCLGVQVLDREFIQADIPTQAKAKAKELGWNVRDGAIFSPANR